MPFTVDLHFGYREKAWTSDEMDLDDTSTYLQAIKAEFDKRFDETFSDPILQVDKYGDWTDKEVAAAKYGLGNMLGSIAYMYGDRMVFENDAVVKQPATHLFTGIPDRPDHSRGFMWDEGFHQHLISVWDIEFTYEIIESWFNVTDQETGWICREQMLGRETRAGAPPTSWP